MEKPGARCAAELDPVADAARKSDVLVRVGFNLRYHRAFRKAREILDTGVLGEPMFVRARYGHGGRPGYDKEWRAFPELSGGGEAIDQGVHLIDLARWFLGEFVDIQGAAPTYYWDMPVEDNAFFLLRTASSRVAFLHASWTEWKNLFSFEYAGRYGKLEITGLGGSYGTERLAHYRMLPEMGPPETTIYEFPAADDSWEAEMADFSEDIRLHRPPLAGVDDAQAALRIAEQVRRGR
jgi:predicted dehydrogenase